MYQTENNGEDEYERSSKYRRCQEFKLNDAMKDYKSAKKNILMTTRFNDSTWNENMDYRNKNPKLGCIYPLTQRVSNQLKDGTILLVLEMNNDQNRIMGIGMVRNNVIIQKYSVYSNDEYNRYSYIGKHRIDRNDMSEEEERIMKVFDILCFKGSKHMKRLQGMKVFPMDMLFRCSKILDLVDFITEMFKKRITT
jgi:hypothetical protein